MNKTEKIIKKVTTTGIIVYRVVFALIPENLLSFIIICFNPRLYIIIFNIRKNQPTVTIKIEYFCLKKDQNQGFF